MSSYLVIDAASRALQQMLLSEFGKEPKLAHYVAAEDGISLKNPTEVIRSGKGQMSLWLYNLTQNEFLRNDTSHRSENKEFPALPLNLHYLLTPLTTNGEADLMMIGKTMQVFYENPAVILNSSADSIHEILRIQMQRLTVDEQSRIWEALSEPYRLSICYQIQVARIDADLVVEGAPVFNRSGQMTGAPEQAGAML